MIRVTQPIFIKNLHLFQKLRQDMLMKMETNYFLQKKEHKVQ